MRYFTIKDARAATSGEYRAAKTVLDEAVREFQSYKTYDVFLSHSFSDADLILGAKKILERQGFTVYVDWIEDPQLNRNNVTKETALHIKGRMHSCKRLVYATSENAKHSKWMPWELGYFDGHKPGQVAIMPLMESEYEDFKGQEYLSLYPVLRKGTVTSHLGGTSSSGIEIYDGRLAKSYSRMAA